jgi:hypothetical protein
MVISFIHSICWRMKLAFYECQQLLDGQRVDLSLSSRDRAAPLEVPLVDHPGASTEKSTPHVLPWLSPRPSTISQAQ